MVQLTTASPWGEWGPKTVFLPKETTRSVDDRIVDEVRRLQMTVLEKSYAVQESMPSFETADLISPELVLSLDFGKLLTLTPLQQTLTAIERLMNGIDTKWTSSKYLDSLEPAVIASIPKLLAQKVCLQFAAAQCNDDSESPLSDNLVQQAVEKTVKWVQSRRIFKCSRLISSQKQLSKIFLREWSRKRQELKTTLTNWLTTELKDKSKKQIVEESCKSKTWEEQVKYLVKAVEKYSVEKTTPTVVCLQGVPKDQSHDLARLFPKDWIFKCSETENASCLAVGLSPSWEVDTVEQSEMNIISVRAKNKDTNKFKWFCSVEKSKNISYEQFILWTREAISLWNERKESFYLAGNFCFSDDRLNGPCWYQLLANMAQDFRTLAPFHSPIRNSDVMIKHTIFAKTGSSTAFSFQLPVFYNPLSKELVDLTNREQFHKAVENGHFISLHFLQGLVAAQPIKLIKDSDDSDSN